MPYGISAYGQSPQIGSPLQHTGSLIQQHMGTGTTTIYAGSESNGSPAAAVVASTALQTTSSQSTSSLFRSGEEKRLTREAMERYLRDRNDMIIVVLHAKVIIMSCCWHYEQQHQRRVEVISFVFLHFHLLIEKQLLRFSGSLFADFPTYSFQLSSSSRDYLHETRDSNALEHDVKSKKKCFASFRINKVSMGKLFN